MFQNIGWIVEAKIKDGQREAFQDVMNDIVAATKNEAGTLNYQYFVSDDGHVLVYERFNDIESAHIHINNWDSFAERWIEAAEPTRMVHLGDLPDDLRDRHSVLAPIWLKPFGGFAR